MTSRSSISLIDIVIVLGLWFCALVNILSPSLNRVALYAVIPGLFLLSLLRNGGFRTNSYLTLEGFLCLFCVCSLFWAKYQDATEKELHQVVGVFLLSFVFAVNAKKPGLVPFLYITYLFLMANCLIYAETHILTDRMSSLYGERLNDDVLDANTFSYYSVFCTFITFLFSRYKNIFGKGMLMLFIIMIPFTFYISLRTASRQILLLQVPFIVFLVFMRFFYKKHTPQLIITILLVLLLALLLSNYVFNTFTNSYLYERTQIDIEEDSRIELMKDAYKVGLEHFPLGVGSGNYIRYSYNSHFSHNTFTELWANLGIVGLILFCWMIFMFCSTQWKRYKESKDLTYISFLAFGIIFICQNMFYSFYTGLWLMGFFILVATHSETYHDINRPCKK